MRLRRGSLDPAQSALLVMDYQSAVLNSIPDADRLIFSTNVAIEVFRRHGGHVCFVLLTPARSNGQSVAEIRRAPSGVAAQTSLGANLVATAPHRDLVRQRSDMVVCKTGVGPFPRTDLDEQLTNLGVTTLVLAGAPTSGVVLSAVTEATDRDYRVIVLSDCTSDPDREIHDTLMERIFPRRAESLCVAELNSWLRTS